VKLLVNEIESTMALSSLKNLSAHARWLYPLTVILLAIALGNVFGLGLGLLIWAGGVLGGAIWLIWSSLQGLGGDVPITLDEALSLGAPSAEEEQKRSVLRALKDLEYERAVGKINDDDYTKLAEHYRTEAKRLLRAVDKELNPERERAERMLAERLASIEVAESADSKPLAPNGGAKAGAGGAAPAAAAPSKAVTEDADEEENLDDEAASAKRPSSDTAL
jgi:hypothetical protein